VGKEWGKSLGLHTAIAQEQRRKLRKGNRKASKQDGSEGRMLQASETSTRFQIVSRNGGGREKKPKGNSGFQEA